MVSNLAPIHNPSHVCLGVSPTGLNGTDSLVNVFMIAASAKES